LFLAKRNFLFFLFVIICCLNGCGHVLPFPESKCIEYRAAFDVGSETTKMKVGKLNDKEIGGRYADTEISNLILVLGFMEKLGIKEVIPVNVNLADVILIDPEFW
jgi:hypothetical protein